MTPLYLWNANLLIANNALAAGEKCCCTTPTPEPPPPEPPPPEPPPELQPEQP